METISNVASTASKMIWGEQNTNTQANETGGNEPISGQQGKGTVNEPFDQGNAENSINPISTTATKSTTEPSTSTPTTTTGSTDPTPSISEHKPTTMQHNPNNVAEGGEPRPQETTDKTGVIGGMGDPTKASDIVPSESSNNPGAPSTVGEGGISQKQQGADRPHAAPEGEAAGAVKEKKDEAEDILKTRDPNDHSGEPMKMHTGGSEGAGGGVPATQEERRQSSVGNPGGQEHGKEPKGTGEQWVKTTGLAAEGGDFDATKPGAGREADRLMEQKGIKKTTPGQPAPPPGAGGSEAHAEKEKVPMGQKIKEKLHIGGHKDK